jgi:polar amino acid transport system substrate-binding protein
MIDPVVVMVRKGHGFPFSKWDDLVGKKGVTNQGESFGSKFDQFMARRLAVYRAKGVEATFRELTEDRADYMVVGLYPGRAEATRLGIREQVEALPKLLMSADMFIAFAKKSSCRRHLKAFGAKVAVMTKDGSVQTKLIHATTEWESRVAPKKQ